MGQRRVMSSAARLRELARNCRDFARSATERRAREELLHIADDYDRQAGAIDLELGLAGHAPALLGAAMAADGGEA